PTRARSRPLTRTWTSNSRPCRVSLPPWRGDGGGSARALLPLAAFRPLPLSLRQSRGDVVVAPVHEPQGEIQRVLVRDGHAHPAVAPDVGRALDVGEGEQAVEFVRGGLDSDARVVSSAEEGEDLAADLEDRLAPGVVFLGRRLRGAVVLQLLK